MAPPFASIQTDENGNRFVSLKCSDADVGSHELAVVAVDTVSGVSNTEAKFKVQVIRPIQVEQIPAAFKDTIVLKSLESQVIADGPVFKLSKEQNLQFMVTDAEDNPSSKVAASANPDGRVELQIMPSQDWMQNKTETFKLKVND